MLFFLFMSLLFSHPTSGLNLTITPGGKTFHLQEPITLLVRLENKGNVPLQIDSRFLTEADETFAGEITLLVTAPKERPLPFLPLFEASEVTPREITKLPTGGSVEQPILLSDFFKLTTSGSYIVQAIYDTTTVSSAKPFWRGRLVSAPITFQIESFQEKK